jgi:fructose/tagatose bisphosphate aldolase
MAEVKNLSDPAEVSRMSRDTGIDFLAVGIGNAHGFYKDAPNIRFDLLEKLASASGVPLVLHGTTGLSDDVVARCVSMGMAKANLGTLIRTRWVEHTAAVIADGKHANHPWRVGLAVKDRLKPDMRHILRVAGSSGRARELS